MALIVAERGLTEKHLAKYFVRRPQKLQPPMAKAQHEAPARRSSNSGLERFPPWWNRKGIPLPG